MPNKWEDWSCPFWCQLRWRPVWQQSISRLKRAVCQRSQVSVQQHQRPSGADSAGWGIQLQHNMCWAPFALSADVVIERGNPIPFWGQTFDSHKGSLTCTQHRKETLETVTFAPTERKLPGRLSVICSGEQLRPCRSFSVNKHLKFTNCC